MLQRVMNLLFWISWVIMIFSNLFVGVKMIYFADECAKMQVRYEHTYDLLLDTLEELENIRAYQEGRSKI